jgi:hypothetical protein
MPKPTRRNRDVCIGGYLVIAEINGTGSVYDEDDAGGRCYFHGDTFREARNWAYEQIGEDPPDDDEDDEPASVEPQRTAQKTPCKQCPWRRKSAAGWLGSGTPESFVATLLLDVEPLPCHSTVNYNRPDWHMRWVRGLDKGAKLCRGAITAARNRGKMPRFGPRDATADHERVFSSFAEFIEHHRGSSVRSWQEPKPETLEFAETNNVRKMVRLPLLDDESF